MGQFNTVKPKNGILLLMCILFSAFQLTSVILYVINGVVHPLWITESIIMVALCLFLCFSYRKHAKNIMKPLLGAVLMAYLFYALEDAFYFIEYYAELSERMPDAIPRTVFMVSYILLAIIILLINIFHYLINFTHHSSPIKIKINKALLVVGIIFLITRCVDLIYASSTIIKIGELLASVADVFLLSMIVIIESSLDEFRIAREERAEHE